MTQMYHHADANPRVLEAKTMQFAREWIEKSHFSNKNHPASKQNECANEVEKVCSNLRARMTRLKRGE